MVVGQVAADFGQVGQIGRNVDVFRRDAWLALGFLVPEQRAFVRGGEIENGEEWLVLAAVFVMRPAGGFIPDGLVVAPEIVVGLGTVGAVVAGLFQVVDVRLVFLLNRIAAAHVLGAHGRGIGPVQNGRAGHRADRCVGVGMLEADAVFGQSVESRGLHLGVAVTAEPMVGVVLGGNPQDIGFVRGSERQSEKGEKWDQ